MILKSIDLLGLRAKDKVTGFEGVISSVVFDLYGCVQCCLTPPAKIEDRKLGENYWFDIHRVEVDDLLPRVMPVPDFAATLEPADYVHGPAEKPTPR